MKFGMDLSFREYLDNIPIIETHEHYTSNSEMPCDAFPILMGYIKSDLRIAAGPDGGDIAEFLVDPKNDFRKKYERFEPLYQKCRHTAYAKAMERGLELCWGIKEISYKSLCELNERLPERTNELFVRTMERFHIEAHVTDIFGSRFFPILRGEDTDYTPISKFAFPLPMFHKIYCYNDLKAVGKVTGKTFSCLEEYTEAVEALMQRAHDWGAVCVKDQSAYTRPLDYTNPTREEAERIFNRIVSYPLEGIGFREGRVLDDWLFQRFVRKAGQLDMPVQLHTGLQDRVGLYADCLGSDITRVNATLLIPTMEQHREARFDLFHANWPYLEEILYIGKNTPNAWIDLCWTHSIDPLYAIELMKRAVTLLPQSRIFGFGGDAFVMENNIGYLEQAKDNIAAALSQLMTEGYLSRSDAEQIALDWLWRNPKEFFGI